MRTHTYLHLGLIAGCLFATPLAQAETAVVQLAGNLHQQLTESPDSFRWFMPNEDKPLTHADVGIEPNQCSQPVPANSEPNPRFLVRCITRQLVGFRVVNVQTVTSWTYAEGDWSTGQIVSIHPIADTSTNRYSSRKVEYQTIWHDGDPLGPYERSFTFLSHTAVSELRAFWENFPADGDISLTTLEQWRQLPWPDGVIGLRRDGKLLLQEGPLAGTSDLLEKVSEKDALPPFAQGLIRPVAARQSWEPHKPPGAPMFLLHTLATKDSQYAIALSDTAPDDLRKGTQLLSSGQHYNLVFLPIERNL